MLALAVLLHTSAQAQDPAQDPAPAAQTAPEAPSEAPAGSGGALLVPEFTAVSVSDISIAFMLYDQLLQDLEARGMDPIDGAELSVSAGEAAVDCADNEACPGNLWSAYPVPLAVVGQVETTDAGLDVTVSFYTPDKATPIKIVNETVFGGAEFGFTADMADLAAALLEAQVGFEPTGPVAPTEPTEPADAPQDGPGDPPEDTPPQGGDEAPAGGHTSLPSGTDADPWDEAERKEMGISKALYERYLASGMDDPDAWLRVNRVRTETVGLEFGGGGAFGSVDRSVTLRLVLQQDSDDDFIELDRYEEDVLTGGRRGQGSAHLYASLSPRWDLGALVAIQYSEKQLTTGWELVDEDGFADEETDVRAPAAAALALVEPRLRFFPRPVGVVKPYLLAHANMRFYDAYILQDTAKVSYQPGRPAMQPLGIGAGLGLALDVTPQLALFVELPYTAFILGADPYRESAEMMENTPEARTHVTTTTRLTAGLGFKF
ncbi:MAG: hypothetical protein VX899_21565 [Myxococcota bacterium]|nr:hypothetical protein [Myxococcota bacterium]